MICQPKKLYCLYLGSFEHVMSVVGTIGNVSTTKSLLIDTSIFTIT